MPKGYTQIVIYTDRETREKLKELCRNLGISMQDLFRSFINSLLKNQTMVHVEKKAAINLDSLQININTSKGMHTDTSRDNIQSRIFSIMLDEWESKLRLLERTKGKRDWKLKILKELKEEMLKEAKKLRHVDTNLLDRFDKLLFKLREISNDISRGVFYG